MTERSQFSCTSAVRNVPRLECLGLLFHPNLHQNLEPGGIPGPLGYGGDHCWNWHTANWSNQLEPEKSVDRHHPKTTCPDRLKRLQQKTRWRNVNCFKNDTKSPWVCFFHPHVGNVTCCILIPDFDWAIVGGRCHASGASRRHGQKHTAGCGLKMTSVLHDFTAGLTQVPELVTHRNNTDVKCFKTRCTNKWTPLKHHGINEDDYCISLLIA